MNNIIYIQSKGKIKLSPNQKILLKNLIDIYVNDHDIEESIGNLEYQIDHGIVKTTYAISVFSIVSLINSLYPKSLINVIGENEVLISFEESIRRESNLSKLLRVGLICFILSISAATAIINFHSDVDMFQTHKTIYRIITGKETDNLLLLQIPYSLGIGTGMSVFFNHIFKKRINNEPSPLEVEVHLYQQNLEQYIKDNN